MWERGGERTKKKKKYNHVVIDLMKWVDELFFMYFL